MALPDTLKVVLGTPLVFAESGEYVPSDAGQPSTIDSEITLKNLATGGVARQAVKLDLGSANIDVLWSMKAYIEWFTAPTAGGTVDFYLGFSNDLTAGEDNPANLSGTDVAYQGYGADAASGLEAVKQLDWIGSLVATNDIDLQVAAIGTFLPTARYAMLVVVNNSSVALAVTDAIETGVAITPIQQQVQE